jgi:CubicO group peptidase (beta-lactamase class C family)
MKKLLILPLLTFLAACLQAQQDPRVARIDSMMTFAAEHGLFNGAIFVSEKGKLLYNKSFGYANYDTKEPVTENTLFNLCSISKQFTATGILMLMEEGKLTLDDSLRLYFPELPYRVTIRQMLHHISGLPDYMQLGMQYWPEGNTAANKEVIELLAVHQPPMLFQPGEKFQYCNTGYVLLAAIFEKLSGRSYADFVRQRIFEPLGMKQSQVYRTVFDESAQKGIAYGYVIDPTRAQMVLPENYPPYKKQVTTITGTFGDGGIFSSSHDMWIWENALKNNKLLKKQTLETAFASGLLNDGRPAGYGFGWFVAKDGEGRRLVQHTGGWPGHRNAFIRFIDEDVTLLVLRNNEVDFMGIQPAVINILESKPFTMPKTSLAQALCMAAANGEPSAISDTYKAVKGNCTIREEDINDIGYGLLASNRPQHALEVFKLNVSLFPQSANAFDSLGEVYLTLGDTMHAKDYYSKSLALNPDNEGAKKALEKIGQ